LPIGLLKRLEIASNLIKTKYCILLGDDEFFIPSALNSAIKTLDKDNKLVACCGQSIGFWPGKIASWLPKSPILLSHIIYPERKGYSISQNNPQKRMVMHMENYSPTSIYSVVRTSDWKKVMSILTKKEFCAYGIFELQFELAISYLGKTKVLDELFWLRSAENENIQGTDLSLQIENSFEKWWVDPKKSTEHREFLQIIGDGLSDDINAVDDIMKYVKISFDSYLKFSKARQLSNLSSLRNKFFFSFPVKFQMFLKNIFLYRGIGKPLEENIREMKRSGTKVDINELMKIEKLVLEFHSINKLGI
jgi:glycosyltransferase domain-containing protein